MSIIRRRCVTITVVCVHVHVSDNRGTLCDAENSWLPVDVEYMETLRDDQRGLRACGEEKQISETTNFTPQHAFKNSISC